MKHAIYTQYHRGVKKQFRLIRKHKEGQEKVYNKAYQGVKIDPNEY